MLESGNHDTAGPCLSERHSLLPGSIVISKPMLLMALSGSVVLSLLGSVLMSVAHVITGADTNHVLNLVLTHKLKLRASLSCP